MEPNRTAGYIRFTIKGSTIHFEISNVNNTPSNLPTDAELNIYVLPNNYRPHLVKALL